MNEKQFIDAFKTIGGWFFLFNYEHVRNWKGSISELIDQLYLKGFDEKRTGTSTRVSSMLRIINAGYDQKALEKIRDSSRIYAAHPDCKSWAESLLEKYF